MGKTFAEKNGGSKSNLESCLRDKKTGEIVDGKEGTIVYISKPRLNSFTEGFMTMGQEAADAAAEIFARKGLAGIDAAVLFRLIAVLDQHNYLLINTVELARSLSLHRPNISRSLKKLIEMGFLLLGPRAGIHRTYRLNPQFGWKGPNKLHAAALAEGNKPGLFLVQGGKEAFKKQIIDVKILRQQRLEGVDPADDNQKE